MPRNYLKGKLRSTYSANNDNPQTLVEAQITVEMTSRGGFSEPVVFKADGHMMSLVYFRGADLFSEMVPLVNAFKDWLEDSKPGKM